MFLAPIVAGFVAGLLLNRRKAFAVTTAVWLLAAAVLSWLSISENDFTIGTAAVVAIGLLGYPLALLGGRIRGPVN